MKNINYMVISLCCLVIAPSYSMSPATNPFTLKRKEVPTEQPAVQKSRYRIGSEVVKSMVLNKKAHVFEGEDAVATISYDLESVDLVKGWTKEYPVQGNPFKARLDLENDATGKELSSPEHIQRLLAFVVDDIIKSHENQIKDTPEMNAHPLEIDARFLKESMDVAAEKSPHYLETKYFLKKCGFSKDQEYCEERNRLVVYTISLTDTDELKTFQALYSKYLADKFEGQEKDAKWHAEVRTGESIPEEVPEGRLYYHKPVGPTKKY